MNKINHKVILMILDGWGKGKHDFADAIFQGNTPYIDSLYEKYPNSELGACGEDVGLPDGQMGNSEVGHMNIGAGQVIYQDIVKINQDVSSGELKNKQNLIDALKYAKENDRNVHFLGLVSDGGVHSLTSHLVELCKITGDYGLSNVFIHAITDGRDTDPHSGKEFVKQMLENIKGTPARLASLIGRYYTMDRDKRWERVKKGYDLMVKGEGKHSKNILESIQWSYDEEVTDEFIKPVVMVNKDEKPIATIQQGDVFICFNFRTDRLRQITTALTQQDFPEFGMHTIPLHYITMTNYDEKFREIENIYPKQIIRNGLGEVLELHHKKQIRIAETEKYAHVTFFFSGGREKEFEGEKRILIPSPKVATYDLQPEMSAYLVRDAILAELEKKEVDFICLNFANGDMVGHTGVFEAILKAVNVVDTCVKDVVETAKKNGYTAIIIADHGNADHAKNDDGSPNTAHSLNPVPCILVSDDYKKIKNGVLADIAPSILDIMGIEKPKEMTGNSLIEKKA